MKKMLFAAAAALAVQGGAMAGEFEIKQYAIGANLKDLGVKMQCSAANTCASTTDAGTVGGSKIVRAIAKVDGERKIVGYLLYFNSSDYDAIKDAVVNKFGEVHCLGTKRRRFSEFEKESCEKSSGEEILLIQTNVVRMGEASIQVIPMETWSQVGRAREAAKGDI